MNSKHPYNSDAVFNANSIASSIVMALPSIHATLLADSLQAYLADEIGWDQAMQQYHAARNEFSLKTYQETCMYSRDVSLMNS